MRRRVSRAAGDEGGVPPRDWTLVAPNASTNHELLAGESRRWLLTRSVEVTANPPRATTTSAARNVRNAEGPVACETGPLNRCACYCSAFSRASLALAAPRAPSASASFLAASRYALRTSCDADMCRFVDLGNPRDFSCDPSSRTLMAESGAGRSTVMRALKELEAKGFITRRSQCHDSGALGDPIERTSSA
jgi:Bacterial regulatory proteins, gntR family